MCRSWSPGLTGGRVLYVLVRARSRLRLTMAGRTRHVSLRPPGRPAQPVGGRCSCSAVPWHRCCDRSWHGVVRDFTSSPSWWWRPSRSPTRCTHRSSWCGSSRSRCSRGRDGETSCGGKLPSSYFFAVWWYIIWAATPERGLPEKYYWAAIALHVIATCVFAAFVVRDILQPKCDPVRSSLGEDDPGGGVLDGAPDRFVLRRRESPTVEQGTRDDVMVVHGRHSH